MHRKYGLCPYYVIESKSLEIIFPKSEGWANMSISVPDGTVIFKDRFHSSFDYSSYVGVPEEPWKVEVVTTQGGEYEGWLFQW